MTVSITDQQIETARYRVALPNKIPLPAALLRYKRFRDRPHRIIYSESSKPAISPFLRESVPIRRWYQIGSHGITSFE
jgi:hypothetical protein